MCKFNAIPVETPTGFSLKLYVDFKVHVEKQTKENSQGNSAKEEQRGRTRPFRYKPSQINNIPTNGKIQRG